MTRYEALAAKARDHKRSALSNRGGAAAPNPLRPTAPACAHTMRVADRRGLIHCGDCGRLLPPRKTVCE